MQFQASSDDSMSFTTGQSVTGGRNFGQDDSNLAFNLSSNGGCGTAGAAINRSGAVYAGSHRPFLSPNHITATNMGLQSTHHVVSQMGNSISNLFLGQLSLTHRLTEVRKAIVTPEGVQFHTVVEFDFTSEQHNPGSNSEAIIADHSMPRSQFRGAQSTRDRPLFQNNNMSHQYESPPVNVRVGKVPNPMNNHPTIPEIPRIPNPSHRYTYPPPVDPREICSQPQPTGAYQPPYIGKHVAADPASSSLQQWKPFKPTVQIIGGGREEVIIGSSSSHPQYEQLKERAPLLVQPLAQVQETADSEETVSDKEYDGKTHSLSRRKHGPYTCPKCRMVFGMSQGFASHVKSHYKFETNAERTRRQMAKQRKKRFRLVQTPHGLTVMQVPSLMRGRKRKAAVAREVGITIREGAAESPENPRPSSPPSAGPQIPTGIPILPPPPGMGEPLNQVPLPSVKAEIEK